MGMTYVQQWENFSDSNTSANIIIDVNTPRTTGNLLVFMMSYDSQDLSGGTLPTPAGWNDIVNEGTLAVYHTQVIAWRICDNTAADSMDINRARSGEWKGIIVEFSGQVPDPSNFSVVYTPQTQASTTQMTSPGIVASNVTGDALQVFTTHTEGSNLTTAPYTDVPIDSGYLASENQGFSNGDNHPSVFFNLKDIVGSGQYGQVTWGPIPDSQTARMMATTILFKEDLPPRGPFGIWSGANEILQDALQLGTTAIQEVYYGALKIWPGELVSQFYMQANNLRSCELPTNYIVAADGAACEIEFTIICPNVSGSEYFFGSLGADTACWLRTDEEIRLQVGGRNNNWSTPQPLVAGTVYHIKFTRTAGTSDWDFILDGVSQGVSSGPGNMSGAVTLQVAYLDETKRSSFLSSGGMWDLKFTDLTNGGVYTWPLSEGTGLSSSFYLDGVAIDTGTWTPDADWQPIP